MSWLVMACLVFVLTCLLEKKKRTAENNHAGLAGGGVGWGGVG